MRPVEYNFELAADNFSLLKSKLDDSIDQNDMRPSDIIFFLKVNLSPRRFYYVKCVF